ncbi:MAG: class I SAM-dependent methyltransferase [Christensenellales bacterium]|jgi:SAM-dependent methyltransferase
MTGPDNDTKPGAPHLEEMGAFFSRRVEMYEEHMLREVEGCREGYARMAEMVPDSARDLLDIGCGTGLELDAIFMKLPGLRVTGIDLSQEMLNRLRSKHPGRSLTLIQGSYIGRDFGTVRFDAAVSFQTLHHLTHAVKTDVYRSLHRALRPGGVYIEADYMAPDQAFEDYHFERFRQLCARQRLPDGLYHYDTPCTIDNQRAMLERAGFVSVKKVWQMGNTVIMTAKKA